MKLAIKHKNGKFLVITLKHVSGFIVIVSRPGNPKLWAKAHGTSHKKLKHPDSGHISQPCIGSYGHCKSPWNPKTVGNS